MPERIQRRRTKGWRMPDGAIYIGRPTRWGNPFQIGGRAHFRLLGRVVYVQIDSAAEATALYRNWVNLDVRYIAAEPPDSRALAELRGHDLACWCPLDQPCHADVLLEIANA
ncbi:MAG: DUF4326 domain-containing protein [Actinomycetota bacterium]